MKVVIFDLDGTLLDSRQAFYWQFQELARIFDDAQLLTEQIDAAAHGTTEQIVRRLVKNTQKPFSEILETHRKLRIAACEEHLRLYDGVDVLLTGLKKRGLKIGALTSGNYLTVDCLARLKIDHHFSNVISAEHVQKPKPHPEGLLLAMKNLDVQPRHTVMVGDTIVDIQVGKNANIHKTIGIMHGFGKEADLQAAGADHLVTDIASLIDVLE